MNFWRPRSTSNFGAIQHGELFLFKTRSPENRVVGGAFLVRHTTLPLDLAWATFGDANGVRTFAEFRTKISSIRGDQDRNPTIGCTVLTQPFFLPDDSSFDAPSDFASNIVMGKTYDVTVGEGLRLYNQAKQAILSGESITAAEENVCLAEQPRYGTETLITPRLGQGGFRVSVLDEYQRRCAITGEKTVPVLDAAHIRPYADLGPHTVSNGLLLRSDQHTLFDKGYMTVTNDLRIEVSSKIREEFSNGREYYALHGRGLQVIPSDRSCRPAIEYLEWHQNNCFLGS